MNVLFASLGCDKNLVDSEVMLGLLRDKGFSLTNSEEEADVIVVNTCCFIGDAKMESIQTILEMAEYKKMGRLKVLLVSGCLAQRYKNEIIEEIPEVDAVIGTTAYDKIVEAIEGALLGKKEERYAELEALPLPKTNRVCTTGGYYSYLKIAEGCNKRCTYCIIPSLRGNYRSVPMERIMEEARFLVEGGAKELILVAQETTVYGVDIYKKKALPELLRKLCKIEGLEWIRILYCYPEEITDELIETIKTEDKICNYLDMPIQHASDAILSRMGRKTNHDELVGLIKKLRKEIPDIVLRTSLITGFPGETEEDMDILKGFVQEVRFDRLGVFGYSREDGTPAAKMKPQITKKVKEARKKEIMKLQQQISFENGKKRVGSVLKVMIEGKLPEDNVYIGRTYMDAPNVDGYVFVTSKDGYMSGDMVDVKITGAKEYDLYGEALSYLD
ncbi:MAG: 30S ribosomal protein S12 methylthiotransferase RimO [Lachnospiraceae bacterium]|nr:30S ribosomal protein S12 methylthiotransferase RimO [Lachnospiraceae bacterium]